MHKDLLELLNHLLLEVKQLGLSLSKDQELLIQGHFDILEQNTIETLERSQQIEALINRLHAQPQWLESINNKEQATLWNTITDEAKKNADLIAVNQQVIQGNSDQNQQTFQCLMNLFSNKDAVVYDKQAQLDTL